MTGDSVEKPTPWSLGAGARTMPVPGATRAAPKGAFMVKVQATATPSEIDRDDAGGAGIFLRQSDAALRCQRLHLVRATEDRRPASWLLPSGCIQAARAAMISREIAAWPAGELSLPASIATACAVMTPPDAGGGAT